MCTAYHIGVTCIKIKKNTMDRVASVRHPWLNEVRSFDFEVLITPFCENRRAVAISHLLCNKHMNTHGAFFCFFVVYFYIYFIVPLVPGSLYPFYILITDTTAPSLLTYELYVTQIRGHRKQAGSQIGSSPTPSPPRLRALHLHHEMASARSSLVESRRICPHARLCINSNINITTW